MFSFLFSKSKYNDEKINIMKIVEDLLWVDTWQNLTVNAYSRYL